MIFVNSMSDLFHKAVPKDHIAKVFDTMEQADWHIYQVLTKRSSLLQKFTNERMSAVLRGRNLPLEQSLGVLAIVGGESGPGARPMQKSRKLFFHRFPICGFGSKTRHSKPGVSKNSHAIGRFEEHDFASVVFGRAILKGQAAISEQPNRLGSINGHNQRHETRSNGRKEARTTALTMAMPQGVNSMPWVCSTAVFIRITAPRVM
jgi:hypothetical protein